MMATTGGLCDGGCCSISIFGAKQDVVTMFE